MMKLHRLIIIFLYLFKCVSLDSTKTIITEVRKKISLPCGVDSQGDITWYKDGSLYIRYKGSQKLQNPNKKDTKHFIIPDLATSNLEANPVQLDDSGTYTCQKAKNIFQTVKLFVFEMSATPSTNPFSSDDLTLKVQLSPEQVPGLQITWKKDDKVIGGERSVQIKNVDMEHNGRYWCHVKMEGAGEAKTSMEVKVFGSSSASSEVVYLKGPKIVVLPWDFNFRVQSTYMTNEVKVADVSITYPSQVVKNFTITNDASCWPEDCVTSARAGHSLDISLSNPRIGSYQMEVVIEMGSRRKSLRRNVCLADLKVSSSDDDLVMESSVTLLCQTNCLDKNGKLCWKNRNVNSEQCGLPGQMNLTTEVTVLPETLGNWTCQVMVEQKTMISANKTLEVKEGFLSLSSYLLWVTVGVGALVLLLIVMIIVILVARSRRMRRAQKRAWLLRNIHQQKKCECKGFPIQRLRENI